MKKKFLSVLLTSAMIASLTVGCGANKPKESSNSGGNSSGNSITVLVESGSSCGSTCQ